VREEPTIDNLRKGVLDERAPIAKRTRSVFKLRQLGGKDAIDALAPVLQSKSVLLSHEAAYAMGQMQNPYAIPILSATLADSKLDSIVRHEAGEALGAIGQPSALPILEKYAHDECREIAETCQLAIARIRWLTEKKSKPAIDGEAKLDPSLSAQEDKKGGDDEAESVSSASSSSYASIDPAPPASSALSTAELKTILLDTKKSLFDRYRAMFALRDRGDKDSILALSAGFHDTSALFKHEIAYVLGQVQSAVAVDALTKMLQSMDEHPMVRHEAAEALGSMPVDCSSLLRKFQKDKDKIVSQSCEVALDIADYWASQEFE